MSGGDRANQLGRRPGKQLGKRGACRGAVHRPHNLGYGGRRVLVSRWWSGKTLTDHRADRRAFAVAVLAEQQADQRPADAGLPDPRDEPERYVWEYAKASDPDVPPLAERIGRALSERVRWRGCLAAARASSPPPPTPDPATAGTAPPGS